MKYLTSAVLRRAGACPKAQRLFKRTFPSGRAALTEKNAIKYVSKFGEFTSWALYHLLQLTNHEHSLYGLFWWEDLNTRRLLQAKLFVKVARRSKKWAR